MSLQFLGKSKHIPPVHYHELYLRGDDPCLLPHMSAWAGEYASTLATASLRIQPLEMSLDGKALGSSPHAYLATVAIGKLVAQVWASRIGQGIAVERTIGPVIAPYAVQVWPSQHEGARWPPSQRIDDTTLGVLVREA